MERYNAGLLGGDDDWTAEQWQDYLRSELENAHDFYADIYEGFAKEVADYVESVEASVFDLHHLKGPTP